MTQITKSMREFLARVQGRQVYRSIGLKSRGGTRYRFVGGEVKARVAAEAGLITFPHVPDLGRPSYAELTDAGRAALSESSK